MCELWTKAVEIMRENPSVWVGFFSAFVLCGVLVICLKMKRNAMRKQGCAAFCAEISLDGYRTSKRQAPCFIAQS